MVFIPNEYRPIPRESDVVIIGSGVIGSATAYYLAQRGIKALILDRSRIASRQSSKAWGFVRQQGREAPEIPLMQQAIKLWENLEHELGVSLQWKQSGCLYTATTKTEMIGFENWAEMASREYGLDTRLLTANEVAELIPNWKASSLGGLYTPSDGQAEPKLVASSFAAKALELGAVFLEGCNAVAIESTGDQITGVHTDGGFIKCKKIVCASGINSFKLLKTVGINLPQQVVRASCSRTNAQPKITDITICGHGLGFRQKIDGSINVGDGIKVDVDITLGHLRALEWYLPNLWSHRTAFDFHINSITAKDTWQRFLSLLGIEAQSSLQDMTFHHLVSIKSKKQLLERLSKVSDLLEGARIVDSWSEQIDVLPDGIPVIDSLNSPSGLLIATGFCGHGFALGPIVGKVLADIIDKGKADIDLRDFRLSRFEENNIRKPVSFV